VFVTAIRQVRKLVDRFNKYASGRLKGDNQE
jgi:hypothetical protein